MAAGRPTLLHSQSDSHSLLDVTMASWEPGGDDSEQSEQSDWEMFSQWGTAQTEWWNESQESQSQEDSVRPPFRGKEGKWRLFSIDDKKERLKHEEFKECVSIKSIKRGL